MLLVRTGKSIISRVVKALPVLTVLVSRIGDSAVIVIDSFTPPTSILTSILICPLIERVRLERTVFLNPGASTVTWYWPPGSKGD